MADTENVVVDVSRFTLGDAVDFEKQVGLPLGKAIEAIGNDLPGSSEARLALVWLTKRLDDPEFTIEQAREIPIGGWQFKVAESDPTNSTDGAAGAD